MADRMEFPKKMKEFIDSYSFKDKEEVYTNGAELIPVFRVEQAMEHYFEQKCKDCAGCTAWNADCANIRAKAIDDFSKRLKENVVHTLGGNCIMISQNMLGEIAEQLKKGGAENEQID